MSRRPPKHPSKEFTAAFIKSLQPEAERYVVREKLPRKEGGFCIRVTPDGAKSWYYVFRHVERKGLGWCHLGDCPPMGLSDARVEFRKARAIRKEGKDPIVVRQEQRQERRDSWTIDKLCDEYLEKYAAIKKRPRSAHEDELNLARDVRPAWGTRKARDIRRGDIVSLLDEIVKRGSKVQANRTLATIRKMFAWAFDREVVEISPAWKITKPATETPKERALTGDEVKRLWPALDAAVDVPSGVKKALKLVLLTGCRPGEVLAARWDQVKDNWLELPGTATKNKRPHRVYLSKLARQVIGDAGEGLIITKDNGLPIPVYALSFWLRRCNHFGIDDWTPHDLRRTCATKLAEAGTPPHIVQRVLNHAQTGITGRVYDQHSYAGEIANALEQWGQTVDMAVSGKTTKVKKSGK